MCPVDTEFEDDFVVADPSIELDGSKGSPCDNFNNSQNQNRTQQTSYSIRGPPFSANVAPFHPVRPTLAKAVELGTRCEAKLLYEGPKQCSCCTNWVDEKPKWYIESKEAKNLTRDFHGHSALLLRKRKGHPGEEPFVLESIDIQSPLIRNVLLKLLLGYPGVDANAKILTFFTPFAPLFHNWEDVLKAASDETSTETRSHLKILVDVLQPVFEDHILQLEECRKTQAVSFAMLWSIFKPGDLIYTQLHEQECAMKLKFSHMSYPEYFLSCEYIDWNGKDFFQKEHHIHLKYFGGTALFKDLIAMPLYMHPERLAIKDRLSDRGRRFESLKGFHFRAYHGPAVVSKFNYAEEFSQAQVPKPVPVI